MNAFFASIAYNVGRLFDFQGRETQILFWPYAAFIYLLATAVSIALVMIPVFEMVTGIVQQIAVAADQGGDAEPAFITSPETLVPDLSGLVVPTVAINLLMIALLAGAIVRRLHDKDRSGLWGLMPLPPMLLGYALLPSTLPEFFVIGEPSPLVALVMLNNLVAFGLTVGLVILLVGPGTQGPNRFGAPSAAPD